MVIFAYNNLGAPFRENWFKVQNYSTSDPPSLFTLQTAGPLACQLLGDYLSDLTLLPFLVLSHEIAIFQCGLVSCQNCMDASALDSEP